MLDLTSLHPFGRTKKKKKEKKSGWNITGVEYVRQYGSEYVTFSLPTDMKGNLKWEENGNLAGKKSQLLNGKSLLWQDLLELVNWKRKVSCWHPEESGHSTLPQLKDSCLELDRSQSRDSSPQGTFSRYLGNSFVSSICFSNFLDFSGFLCSLTSVNSKGLWEQWLCLFVLRRG